MSRFVVVIVIAIVLVLVGIWYFSRPKAVSALDGFAQCLAAKGVTMYGADWCPHCQNEKKAFGSAFEYVPYVECPDNPNVCIEKGIKGYPTWVWPNGKKLEGEQGLKKLSSESGCALP